MFNTLGLAYRAKKACVGAEKTVEAIRAKDVCLVFVASDAAKNTTKMMRDKTDFYHVPLIDSYDTTILSKAVGKNNIKVIGIQDRGFCQLLIEKKGK